MSDETEKLKKLIASNARSNQDFAPYYVQQDLEPPTGGRSLLHDENGRPLHKRGPPVVNKKAPVGLTPDTELVPIRGIRSENAQVVNNSLQHRMLNPLHTAVNPAPAQERFQPIFESEPGYDTESKAMSIDEVNAYAESQYIEDTFKDKPDTGIPVHVGNHEDHGWYDHNVTGAFIDNNKYVDVDALQGVQKLPNNINEKELLESKIQESSWSKNKPPRPVISDVVSGLNQEEMCVIVKGDPIYVSSDKKKIIKCVEDAMLKFEISITDIVVIKRMGLDFGLTMK